MRLELGQFDEGIWRELTAEYNIATSGQKHAEKEASLSELLDKHFRGPRIHNVAFYTGS
ncbi:MAG: hypothetical protein LZ159_06400 [Thaumarchaeota archaeon]|nr:hypothetical protein [Candidatus Terraquivivens yellowstonensis]